MVKPCDFVDLDEWPTDSNDLMIRLQDYWSHTTWLLDGRTPAYADLRHVPGVDYQIETVTQGRQERL